MTRKEIIGFYNGGFMSELLLAHLVGKRRDARAILVECGLLHHFAEGYYPLCIPRPRSRAFAGEFGPTGREVYGR